MSALFRLLRDDSGTAAIEYGVICATMAAVMVASLKGLGPAFDGVFATINKALAAAR
jgi:Flp pilus assembly pilin Flp